MITCIVTCTAAVLEKQYWTESKYIWSARASVSKPPPVIPGWMKFVGVFSSFNLIQSPVNTLVRYKHRSVLKTSEKLTVSGSYRSFVKKGHLITKVNNCASYKLDWQTYRSKSKISFRFKCKFPRFDGNQ